MTRGASEVGLYVASGGKQSAMLGFFPIDEGDAPESYGCLLYTSVSILIGFPIWTRFQMARLY